MYKGMVTMIKEIGLVDSNLRVKIIHSVEDMEKETEKVIYDLVMKHYDIEEIREENEKVIIKYYID